MTLNTAKLNHYRIRKTAKHIEVFVACPLCGHYRWVRQRQQARLCNECRLRAIRDRVGLNFRGGIRKHQGYVWVWRPSHSRATSNGGYVKRAVLVLEEKLGRPLLEREVAHHVNGVKEVSFSFGW